jgi:hypothetical protein
MTTFEFVDLLLILRLRYETRCEVGIEQRFACPPPRLPGRDGAKDEGSPELPDHNEAPGHRRSRPGLSRRRGTVPEILLVACGRKRSHRSAYAFGLFEEIDKVSRAAIDSSGPKTEGYSASAR